jgi:hypothetical protein
MLFVILGDYIYRTLPDVIMLRGSSTPPSAEIGWWIQMARLTLVAMLVGLCALVAYTWRKHGGTGRQTGASEEAVR